MNVAELNKNLNNIFKEINREQKKVFLVDFNIDMMHCNEYTPTNEFLVLLASNSYLSYIIQANRHTSHLNSFQNPIKNIFSNRTSKDILSR